MDDAKHHNKRISVISRKERDKKWFNNLMAQDKVASENNLRSAQDENDNYPGIRKMSYGVNVLLGKPPFEKAVTEKLLVFDHEDDINNIGFLDYSNYPSCEEYSTASDVSYSYSSDAFQQQASSYGVGISAEFNLGVPLASTAAEISLAFSTSKISGSLKKSALQHTSHSIYTYGQKTLFKASLIWDVMTKEAYDSHFLDECAGLGDNPSDVDVVRFFTKFGTHGYQEATFGKRCTSLMVMEGTGTKEEMEEWATNTRSLESTFFWFHSSKSNEIDKKNVEVKEHNFTYTTTNNMCIGLATDNGNCKETSLPPDDEELSEILHWAYKPIWKMDVPGLSVGAKNKMEGFFGSVLEKMVSCGTKNCDSNGVCPVSGRMEASSDDMIDANICTCDNGYEGISCMETDAAFNLALAGEVTAGPHHGGNAIDNKKNTNTGSLNELEVELAQFSKISRIVVWHSNLMFSTVLLEILDSSGKLVRGVKISSATESEKFDYQMEIQDNVMGKFVRIKTEIALSIAEVQVYGVPLQVRKLDLTDVSQSSTENKSQQAKMAVDGDKKSVSCTKQEKKPSWEVRFGKEEVIQKVVVWNRQQNSKYLSNSVVEILSGNIVTTSKPIGDARGDPMEFDFNGARGDTVRIIKNAKSKISLAEVEVYVYER